MLAACGAESVKWTQEEVPRHLGLEVQFQKECKQVWILGSLAFWKEGRAIIGLAFPLQSQSSGSLPGAAWSLTYNHQGPAVLVALVPASKTSILREQKLCFPREAS